MDLSTSAPEELPVPPADLFPLRVASVDVGSNAIRFLAAEFAGARARPAQLDYQRVPVRLGHSAFLTRQLDRAAMDAALTALEGFRRRMEALSIRHYRAVATSAVRESRNGAAFVERVWKEAGLRLEPITGTEEGRLVWLAIRSRLSLRERAWILADLGGGSVEVSLVQAEEIRWTESLPLGTVRLLEELGEQRDGSPKRLRRLLEEYTAALKGPVAAQRGKVSGMVATGGNAEELAELAGARPDEAGVSVLTLAGLRDTVELLAGLSYRQRIEKLGLREDRADVILPAAIVYERLAEMAGATIILVPNVGVKEGLLLDQVDDLVSHRLHEERHEQEILEGALALGRRYDFDEPHARQVTRLALQLFDALPELHGLGEAERRILLGAGLLHDVGQFVSYRKHHKHSHYLIQNSEIPGFTPHEIELVALVARYHRRAEPKDSHEGWVDLSDVDQERVAALAGLLRLADSLDREHRQQVERLHVRAGDREVLLDIESPGDVLLEQWALEKKGKLFERVFGVKLRVSVTTG